MNSNDEGESREPHGNAITIDDDNNSNDNNHMIEQHQTNDEMHGRNNDPSLDDESSAETQEELLIHENDGSVTVATMVADTATAATATTTNDNDNDYYDDDDEDDGKAKKEAVLKSEADARHGDASDNEYNHDENNEHSSGSTSSIEDGESTRGRGDTTETVPDGESVNHSDNTRVDNYGDNQSINTNEGEDTNTNYGHGKTTEKSQYNDGTSNAPAENAADDSTSSNNINQENDDGSITSKNSLKTDNDSAKMQDSTKGQHSQTNDSTATSSTSLPGNENPASAQSKDANAIESEGEESTTANDKTMDADSSTTNDHHPNSKKPHPKHENEHETPPSTENNSSDNSSAPEPSNNESSTDDEDGPREKVLVDYASKLAGAQVLEKSPSLKGTSNLLTGDIDRYAIAPCDDKKYVVIGLSEDILVKQIKLSNYEKYSSHVKEFQVLASQEYPVTASESWSDLGVYMAKSKSGEQAFELKEPSWARYLKVRFLSHYGVEHYCTVSQIKVHGSTMLQGFHEQWIESEKKDREFNGEEGEDEEEDEEDEDGEEDLGEEEVDEDEMEDDSGDDDKGDEVEESHDEKRDDSYSTDKKEGAENEIYSNEAGEPQAIDSVTVDAKDNENQNDKSRGGNSSAETSGGINTKIEVDDAHKRSVHEDADSSDEGSKTASEEEIDSGGDGKHLQQTGTVETHTDDNEGGGHKSQRATTTEEEGKSPDPEYPAKSDGSEAIVSSDDTASKSDNSNGETNLAGTPEEQQQEKSNQVDNLEVKNESTPPKETIAPIRNDSSIAAVKDVVKAAVADATDAIKGEVNVAVNEIKKMVRTKITGYDGDSEVPTGTSNASTSVTDENKVSSSEASDGGNSPEEVTSSEQQHSSTESKQTQSEDVLPPKIYDNEKPKVGNGPTKIINTGTSPPAKVTSILREEPKTIIPSKKDVKNAAVSSGELIAKLSRRFPSAACIKELDFKAFKTKTLLANAGPGAQVGGGAKMEPIFAKITNEIKSVQISQQQYEQYISVVKLCYEKVFMDVANELDSLQANFDDRLSNLERTISEMSALGQNTAANDHGSMILTFLPLSAISSILPFARMHESPEILFMCTGIAIFVLLLCLPRRKKSKQIVPIVPTTNETLSNNSEPSMHSANISLSSKASLDAPYAKNSLNHSIDERTPFSINTIPDRISPLTKTRNQHRDSHSSNGDSHTLSCDDSLRSLPSTTWSEPMTPSLSASPGASAKSVSSSRSRTKQLGSPRGFFKNKMSPYRNGKS